MQFTFTLSIKATCINCQQTITQQEFSQGNCELTLPVGTFQHKSCPVVKTNPYQCTFPNLPFTTNQKKIYEKP
jgi:reverse gyrase